MMGNVIATKDVTICGCEIRNNKAGAFGAGVFFTSNDLGEGNAHDPRHDHVQQRASEPQLAMETRHLHERDTPDPIDSDIRP